MIQYQIFRVPAETPDAANEALNRFVRSHQVLRVEQHYDQGAWHFCVHYLSGTASSEADEKKPAPIDYREVLTAEEFVRFLKLKEWRKTKAEAMDTKVYNVVTNAQLAEIVQKQVVTLSGLGAVTGMGKKRLELYGDELVQVLQELMNDEASGQSAS